MSSGFFSENAPLKCSLSAVLRVDTVISPYSMASDVNFVLDRLSPSLSLFAGGSGQAFKFAPLIGDSLARLACGEQPAVDLTCWSHQRDAVRA